ncbi:hypothetical protein BT69DRAFT_140561 [Atractiella rhizophila]|nr:hypothetical protein BT69DRAFT_140561 [Atractiella rhizophila]
MAISRLTVPYISFSDCPISDDLLAQHFDPMSIQNMAFSLSSRYTYLYGLSQDQIEGRRRVPHTVQLVRSSLQSLSLNSFCVEENIRNTFALLCDLTSLRRLRIHSFTEWYLDELKACLNKTAIQELYINYIWDERYLAKQIGEGVFDHLDEIRVPETCARLVEQSKCAVRISTRVKEWVTWMDILED